LLHRIEAIHVESDRTYGSPRIQAELRAEGRRHGHNRIAHLMREAGLKTRVQLLRERSRRGRTFEHVACNTLQRQFWAPAPNQRWVSDITHIASVQGWLYLAAIMDLYSRAIVGWAMRDRLTQDLTLEALRMALWRRGKVNGLLLHSDQGAQYRSADYHAILKAHGITCSMSRKGECLDNAAMESFFHSLKTERTHHRRYLTRDEARQDVFEYIETFYNSKRRHSYLDYRAPLEFERIMNVS
jgi:putative transposase